MRRLLVTPQFERDLKHVPHDIITAGDEVIAVLRENPLDHTLNIMKLQGFNPPLWRVRIRNYRLVYSISDDSLTLHRFRHRKDIYRNL